MTGHDSPIPFNYKLCIHHTRCTFSAVCPCLPAGSCALILFIFSEANCSAAAGDPMHSWQLKPLLRAARAAAKSGCIMASRLLGSTGGAEPAAPPGYLCSLMRPRYRANCKRQDAFNERGGRLAQYIPRLKHSITLRRTRSVEGTCSYALVTCAR